MSMRKLLNMLTVEKVLKQLHKHKYFLAELLIH